MCHCSTSARPSHGRSQPAWRWLSARSQACVRSRPVGSEPDAPLASPGSARQPLDFLSAAVWVAQFLVAWPLTPQLDGSDTLPDDVPATPPRLLQDFSTRETDQPLGSLVEPLHVFLLHNLLLDHDSPGQFPDGLSSKQRRFLSCDQARGRWSGGFAYRPGSCRISFHDERRNRLFQAPIRVLRAALEVP